MRLLDGQEMAGYIKERQARQVRHLRQNEKVTPVLAIVKTSNEPVIETYVRMKKAYGRDIGIDVYVHEVADGDLMDTISQLNNDETAHAIIVQLPLNDDTQVEPALNLVNPEKDVDGLSGKAAFTPATAMAIDWLLGGYNIDLKDKKIAIVGAGRLVGGPLLKLWQAASYNVTAFDENSKNVPGKLKRCDVVVSAAGVPGLISTNSIKSGAVVVDAATSSEHGKIIGDVAEDVRVRRDVTITPEKGGVGPLTVCALFDNVIRAVQDKVR